MTQADKDRGQRLRRLVDARWGRERGGIRGISQELGVAPETMYAWFRGESEPKLPHLTQMAGLMGLSRSLVVAVMDGERPVLDAEAEAEVHRQVDEALARPLAEIQRRLRAIGDALDEHLRGGG